MKTFEKVSKKVVKEKHKVFPVWVVVRHTRAGDQRIKIIDDENDDYSRICAMQLAEEVANKAAQDYGFGSSSVFHGKLTLAKEAEKP